MSDKQTSTIWQAQAAIGGMRQRIVDEVPQLKRGQVWCRECGSTQRVNSAEALGSGWPKCCGYTMTIDSPEEQKGSKS